MSFSYIVSERYGYVRALLNRIQRIIIIDEFESLCIITGYTPEDKTWWISSFAEYYYEIVC